MSVVPGYFDLSPEQRRFQILLERYPRFQSYWNFEFRECDSEALQRDNRVFSHGEQIIASFLHSVWCGDDSPGFPFIDAAKSLSADDLKPIREWFSDPFFP
jgi:hypothetical protein